MSFLFGGGRPQPSSAEKLARAEIEVEMVSDLFNRSHNPALYYFTVTNLILVSLNLARKSVYLQIIVKQSLTRGSRCVSTDAFPSSSKSISRLGRRCRRKPSTKALLLDRWVSVCEVVRVCGLTEKLSVVKRLLAVDDPNRPTALRPYPPTRLAGLLSGRVIISWCTATQVIVHVNILGHLCKLNRNRSCSSKWPEGSHHAMETDGVSWMQTNSNSSSPNASSSASRIENSAQTSEPPRP